MTILRIHFNLSLLRFFGTVGTAIVTMNDAYLFTDSNYWLQAQQQLDQNWRLIKAGDINQHKDWIEWLIVSDEMTFIC